MPVDPEYIEQLVLEEITGTITPEDSITLKRLLEQEPEAYAIWQRIHRQLTGSYMLSVRESLTQLLPAEQIITVARRRKRRSVLIGATMGIAASLLVLSVLYRMILPEYQPVSPVEVPSFALKSVALQLPGGQLIYLGSGQQQKADGITFREEAGILSWSGIGSGKGLASLVVPFGKDYAVRLPDGTEVMLNAATILQLPLQFGDSREVTVKGEAYFNIAKSTKPFLVHLPWSTIQVLGTAFNVNTYDSGQVKVALESGEVKIRTNGGDLLLQPGNAVHYQRGVRPLATAFDAATLLSWKHRYYVFEDTPISAIGDVIERTYHVQVHLDSKATAEKTYSSRLEKDQPLKKFLERLKTLNKINYHFENGDSVLHLLYQP